MGKKLLIYIPAFDEEKNIGEVLEKLPKQMEGFSEVEVLVVDDGSSDGTAERVKEKGAILYSHQTNKGVGAAFHTAVQKALERHADCLVSIDADGQFNSIDIPRLINPILEGRADMVTGNRFQNSRPHHMPRLKYWGNRRMARMISKIGGKRLSDAACGFRAYNREALLNLNLFGRFTYTQETLLDLLHKGFRVVEVPVHVRYFEDRKSRVAGNVLTYAMRSFNIIMKAYRDYQPLKFFGYGGIILFVIGLGFDLFVLIHYFKSGQFTPYKAFGFLGGLLNMLGLLTFIVGLLADMIDRVRWNQEKLLYYQKKREYDETK